MKNTITVVTTFSKENWNAYANRSIPTWLTYFDSAVNFHFHCEWQPIYDSRINYINPSDEKENFLSRNYLIDRKYNKNRKNQGYTTRWDVYCHKVFAQCESALIAETDLLLFLDADVACISPITSEILFEFIENNFCGYVGRTSPGTETGFLLYNLTKDPDKKFFKEFLEIYTGDKIFDFDQWDDCFIFDHCRSNSSLGFQNLSGQYTNFLDPIAVGPLGEFFDHWLSKKSKRQGSSKFRKFRGKI